MLNNAQKFLKLCKNYYFINPNFIMTKFLNSS